MSEEAIYDDGVEEAEVEAQDVEQVEVDEPESTDEPKAEKHGKVVFSEEQQRFINDEIVAKKTAKMREIERQSEQYRAELEALRQQVPKDAPPTVPPMPDPWDGEFERKVEARDAAILTKAKWDAAQEYRQQQEQYVQQQSQQASIQQLRDTVQSYTERAEKSGIKEKELQAAGNTIATYGMDHALVNYILNDPDGPAMTMHLAQNIADIEVLRGLDPIRAGVYLETKVKPLAKKGRKPPPEPTDSPRGSGMAEKSRGPKGATFE